MPMSNFTKFITNIYGKNEMKDNMRLIRTLCMLAKMHLDEEVFELMNSKNLSGAQIFSKFRAIFKMIFAN